MHTKKSFLLKSILISLCTLSASFSSQLDPADEFSTYIEQYNIILEDIANREQVQSGSPGGANTILANILFDNTEIVSLIHANRDGAVLSEVVRNSKSGKKMRDLSKELWFIANEQYEPFYGYMRGDVGNFLLQWSQPIIVSSESGEQFDGSILMQINLKTLFSHFARKIHVPFQILYGDNTFYNSKWKSSYEYTVKDLIIPGARGFFIKIALNVKKASPEIPKEPSPSSLAANILPDSQKAEENLISHIPHKKRIEKLESYLPTTEISDEQQDNRPKWDTQLPFLLIVVLIILVFGCIAAVLIFYANLKNKYDTIIKEPIPVQQPAKDPSVEPKTEKIDVSDNTLKLDTVIVPLSEVKAQQAFTSRSALQDKMTEEEFGLLQTKLKTKLRQEFEVQYQKRVSMAIAQQAEKIHKDMYSRARMAFSQEMTKYRSSLGMQIVNLAEIAEKAEKIDENMYKDLTNIVSAFRQIMERTTQGNSSNTETKEQ